jgi:hypothetical protein
MDIAMTSKPAKPTFFHAAALRGSHTIRCGWDGPVLAKSVLRVFDGGMHALPATIDTDGRAKYCATELRCLV